MTLSEDDYSLPAEGTDCMKPYDYDWFPDLRRVTTDDLYFNNDVYKALTHSEKMTALWNQLTTEGTT